VLASDLGGEHVSGLIVETEAYLGIPDPASHAWRGRRTRHHAGIWAAPGTWYVYRSYGIHWCLNLTCGPADLGAAVLIRAVEPLAGIDTMQRRRGRPDAGRLADGPGKLGQAFGIDAMVDGMPAGPSAPLRVGPMAGRSDARRTEVTPRVGISRAAEWPLRFVLRSPGQ
jgi:DNA-3-methyladenine glycosylase